VKARLARYWRVVLAVLFAVLAMCASPAAAQTQPPEPTTTAPGDTTTTTPAPTEGPTIAVAGTLRADGEPVAGVTIRVTDADGQEVETVETADDGRWTVPLPAPGQYTIELDESTLPEGVTLQEGRRASVQLTVVAGRTGQAAFPLVGEDGAGPAAGRRPLSDRLSQAIANGIKFGLIIAMTAVGLSLIFGTTGLVNFAHGELVTFGAIAAWFLNTSGVNIWGLDLADPIHLIPAAVLAVLLGAAFGGALDLGLWRPLRNRGTGAFQRMVISIGLSLALRQLLLIWFGSRSPRYRDYAIQTTVDIGPVAITPRDLWVMGLSLATLLGIALLLQLTRVGRAMRAVSDNPDLAESSGVDVQQIILWVWVLGAGLAALGGVFQGAVTNVNYLSGFQLLLLMFAAIVLGGLGTAYGAIVGSLVVGLATEVSTVWLSSELKSVWALAVLVVVLLVRPQGILGVRERVS
jgi:neutral amino acid transport system permease protein